MIYLILAFVKVDLKLAEYFLFRNGFSCLFYNIFFYYQASGWTITFSGFLSFFLCRQNVLNCLIRASKTATSDTRTEPNPRELIVVTYIYVLLVHVKMLLNFGWNFILSKVLLTLVEK